MKTDPVDELITRNVRGAPYGAVCKDASELIEELVNFGTHVLNRISKASSDKGIAALPPICLFRHIVRSLDAVSILALEAGAESAKPLLRSGLEACFGFLYMTKEDSENRALSYIVCDSKRELRKFKRFNTKDPTDKAVRKRIEKQFQKVGFKFSYSEKDRAEETTILSYLNKPILKHIVEEYNRTRDRGLKNPSWYNLFDGPGNIQALADTVELTEYFELFYRLCSEQIHGSNLLRGGFDMSPDG